MAMGKQIQDPSAPSGRYPYYATDNITYGYVPKMKFTLHPYDT